MASLSGFLLLLALGVLARAALRVPSVARLQDRLHIRSEEIRRVAEAREQLAAAQAVAEGAVHGGTATVRAIHKGIASIPFTILENIPATRDTTRQVRRIHDAISDGVYAGISIGNKLIGHAARSAINPLQADTTVQGLASPQADAAAASTAQPEPKK
ncbi:MAG: hypothetical protein ACRESS_06015 [Stenotrophobium sp.]